MITELDLYLKRVTKQVAWELNEKAVTILEKEGEFSAAQIACQDVNPIIWEH